MFGKEYDYLRLSSKRAQTIQHSPAYIKQTQGNAIFRNIFYNQDLDNFEKKSLSDLDVLIG